MGIPLKQQFAVAKYLIGKKLTFQKKYPLVLMLEPLFRCNLACAGCGKIDYEDEILNKRLTVEECVQAAEECGAPVISVAGGEPLIHKEMPQIIQEFVKMKRFVYLCTNAILLKSKIDDYEPSPYLTFSIHLDGNKNRHDTSVCREGVYEQAVEAIKLSLSRGFRTNINCTLFQNESPEEVEAFLDEMMALGVEGVTIAPGFNYERAPQQDIFLKKQNTHDLFKSIFNLGRSKKWRLNHSSLYLDFLAGGQNYNCTPWGNPTRNVFGWQKPCYLLVSEGYAKSFNELMETTPWEKYGTEKNPKCAQCMAHCGYEATAVEDAFQHPLKALKVSMKGPAHSLNGNNRQPDLDLAAKA